MIPSNAPAPKGGRAAGLLPRVGLAILAGLAAFAPVASAQVSLSEAIVARVNGKPILLSQLKEAALDLQIPLSSITSEGLHGEGFRKTVSLMVDDELLVQAAEKEELKPDETEIAARVDKMIKSIIERLGGQQPYAKFLENSRLTADALRKTLTDRARRQDLSTGIVARRVRLSGEEIEEFRKRKAAAGEATEEALVAQIFVQCPKDDRESGIGKAQWTKALDLARQAGKDPASFGKLAKEKSDDAASRDRGGQLGYVDPATLQPPLRDRLATLKVNQVSEPVTTDTGFHILMLVDRHETRDLLFAERFDDERTKLLVSLRSRASIELYPLN